MLDQDCDDFADSATQSDNPQRQTKHKQRYQISVYKIKTLEILKRDFPKIKVIVLTNYNQPQLIEVVKKLGAHGYLLKNTPSAILKEAISKVAHGELYFEEEVSTDTEENHYFIDDFMKCFTISGFFLWLFFF